MHADRWHLAVVVLALVYLAAAFAGFIAPEHPAAQRRDVPFAPPTRLHFLDADGQRHLRPFVYRLRSSSTPGQEYEEDRSQIYPVQFFVRGAQYRLAGVVAADWHLFGSNSPTGIFLFGSDDYGRDVFSRLLHGGQISLLAGLLGAGLSLTLGMILGGLAGYYGTWVDEIIMRTAELFLALPWLYLLLAVRMTLPLSLAPAHAFFLVLAVIGVVGWARPARLIRGAVLSARTREYVMAAACLGASDWHLLRRHIFPQVRGIAATQASLLVPQFVLAEVTLSFVGLGVGEPVPSWGSLLASLQRYHVVASYWWMFLPAVAMLPVFLSYYAVADALHPRTASVQS